MKKFQMSRGNRVMGKDTIIFNMGSATDCPSRRKCKLRKNCYALKAEISYPDCRSYRDRQKTYWLNSDTRQLIFDFGKKIRRMHHKPKYFRFNESGDFWSQDCVDKLDGLAEYLNSAFGIKTYGFTARRDLDFSKASFCVKGSGHRNANNGKTAVKRKWQIKGGKYFENNEVYKECPMNCRDCSMCKEFNNLNIVFPMV